MSLSFYPHLRYVSISILIFMNSPMWGEMIKKYGAEKAEELQKQCKANIK